MKLITAMLALACLTSTVDASAVRKWIDRTNQPPVVVTNAPPPGPVAPPQEPVPPEQPDPGTPSMHEWKTSLVWSRPLPWKGKFFIPVGETELISTYNRDSRHNSEIHLRKNGKISPALWRGNEETIGQLPEVEPSVTPHAGKVYMCAEVGKNFLIYDPATERVTRGAAITGDTRFNVESEFWTRIGKPVAGATGRSAQAVLLDMTNGREVHRFGIKGLIAALAEGPDGEMWIAVSDGSSGGIYSTGGAAYREIKAASVAWLGNSLYMGGMDVGKLYRRVGNGWKEVHDFRCSKLNMLVPRGDGTLLVAGSRPDTLARWHPDSGRVEIIARWEDESQVVSGEQFDVGIRPGADGRILGFRSHAKGTEFYQAVPK